MIALLLLALLSTTGSATAQPCDCGPMPAPCAGYWGATTVFTGRVDRVARDAGGYRRVTFTILERHRGISSSEVVVSTGPTGQRCSLSFRTGHEYMVYAQPDERGRLMTAACLRTREIEDAAADLAYLQALKEASAPPGRISGRVQLVARDLAGKTTGRAPAIGMTVAIVKDPSSASGSPRATSRGDGVVDTTVTDRAGDFAFEPPARGRYSVRVDTSDRYYIEDLPVTVELADLRACAHITQRVFNNGRITGRVVDASGQPVPGLTIDVTGAPSRAAAPQVDQPSRRTITDSTGRYTFARLPSGRFTVGINITRARQGATGSLPRIFHPGVAQVTRATAIVVADSTQVTLADLQLSPTVSYVSLSGVVVDVDGLPADNARVYLKGAGEDDTIIAEPATTDTFGRFVIAGLSNVGYRLFAERTRSDGSIHRVDSTDQIAVIATRGVAPVRLRLRQRY